MEEKYKDPALVADLISRKTANNQFEPNPDVPDLEDFDAVCSVYLLIHDSYTVWTRHMQSFQECRLYWCWKTTSETEKDARVNEVGTSMSGRLDAATAKNLMS